VKRTISARADGPVCIGREAVPVGVFLFRMVPVRYLITLHVEFEIIIALFTSTYICFMFPLASVPFVSQV